MWRFASRCLEVVRAERLGGGWHVERQVERVCVGRVRLSDARWRGAAPFGNDEFDEAALLDAHEATLLIPYRRRRVAGVVSQASCRRRRVAGRVSQAAYCKRRVAGVSQASRCKRRSACGACSACDACSACSATEGATKGATDGNPPSGAWRRAQRSARAAARGRQVAS